MLRGCKFLKEVRRNESEVKGVGVDGLVGGFAPELFGDHATPGRDKCAGNEEKPALPPPLHERSAHKRGQFLTIADGWIGKQHVSKTR